MKAQVGAKAPDCKCEFWQRGFEQAGKITLKSYLGGWVVLFFYPNDFSVICPTELGQIAALADEFAREDASIIAASTDSFHTHKSWFQHDDNLAAVNFPVIADTTHKLSTRYGVLGQDGAALRGTFIIDPDGILRHASVNDTDVGRNIHETLRILQALQSGHMCTAGWNPGDDVQVSYAQRLSAVFPRVKRSLLSSAAEEAHTQIYEPGDIIISQGARADRFYILDRGTVSVVHHTSSGQMTELAKLHDGDVFGEVALMTGSRRTADVVADTGVSLLVLDWQTFKSIIDQSDPTANDFMNMVNERLQRLPAS